MFMVRKSFYRISLLLSFMVLQVAQDLCCLGFGGYRRGYGDDLIGFDPYRFERAEGKLEKLQIALKKLRATREQFIQLQRASGAKSKADLAALRASIRFQDVDAIDNEIRRQESLIEKLAATLDRMATGTREMTPSQILFKGLAGEDFYNVDDIDGVQDAFVKGSLCVVSREVSEFVRQKTRVIFQDKLGVLFDGAINGISDAFERCREFFFHDGFRPFEEEKLIAWQAFVKTLFDDIDKVVKDGLKDVGRAYDQTARTTNIDGDGMGDDTGVIGQEPAPVKIWSDLFQGYVMQYTFFIMALEDRKGYYEQDSFEIFFATQIQERMRQFCQVLLRVQTVTDMDNYLGVNKAIISAYRTNIDNLFTQLQQQIKRRTFTSSASPQQSVFDRSEKKIGAQRDRYAGGYGDDSYPHSGWAR